MTCGRVSWLDLASSLIKRWLYKLLIILMLVAVSVVWHLIPTMVERLRWIHKATHTPAVIDWKIWFLLGLHLLSLGFKITLLAFVESIFLFLTLLLEKPWSFKYRLYISLRCYKLGFSLSYFFLNCSFQRFIFWQSILICNFRRLIFRFLAVLTGSFGLLLWEIYCIRRLIFLGLHTRIWNQRFL